MKQKNGCMNVVEDKKSEKAFVLEVCMKNKLNVIVVVLLIILGFTSCTSHMNQSESDEIYAEKIKFQNNIEEILDNLTGHGYHITVRPHPQYVRHFEEKLKLLAKKYEDKKDIELQLDFSSNKTVFDADVLITDWSGIAYEYSFTTLKPTLFINTPMKIMNPDYKEIDIVPFDIEARDQVGISVDTDKLSSLNDSVQRLLTEEIYSKESLAEIRSKYLYNVGTSANVGAKYIIKQLIN